ncbi:MAG: Nif3-like dinuclear metal center hexameric protein [Pirellulales bacterium]|nr:Nif3-like dinuclear metal center hexameric protein [Pirellulales bacterium]
MNIHSLIEFLNQFAPPYLAEEWDNVGLLVGDPDREARRVMTCLTIAPDSAREAIDRQADLIVTHHPLPFAAVKRITADTVPGRLLLDLIAARIAVYSPHTAFDSAPRGINERLAEGLRLRDVAPLKPHPQGGGSGRCGTLAAPRTLCELGTELKRFLNVERLQFVGQAEQKVRKVAVGCGAAGEFLPLARENACDCLVVGEIRFHACLEAESLGIGLLMPGHFASERFALDCLAEVLAENFPDLEIWPSRREKDPVRWG